LLCDVCEGRQGNGVDLVAFLSETSDKAIDELHHTASVCKLKNVTDDLFVVGVDMMHLIKASVMINDEKFLVMIDSGANVNLGPKWLVSALGLVLVPHSDSRKIGTAKEADLLVILGWIFPYGVTGPIAIVDECPYILLAVIQLQAHGMGILFPEKEFGINSAVCILTRGGVVFAELEQSSSTNLYFIDLRKLLDDYVPTYVAQSNDETSVEMGQLGGNLGYVVASTEVQAPTSVRKRIPTWDISFRVWRGHRNANHMSLTTMGHMMKHGLLHNVDFTYSELMLVRDHQHCLACALAKWKELDSNLGSGMRINVIGHSWSMDYKGPYQTKAIGGFNGKFIFVDISCGYIVVFLVKSKTEAFQCVKNINNLCIRFGHIMRDLRVDMGRVENGNDFLMACHAINMDRGQPGIEIRPANVEMQKQNPVERYIQTFDNMDSAILVDQDLLPASFWGLSALDIAKTMNATTNTLSHLSTPNIEFEARLSTDASKMFRFGFGQAVIATKTGNREKVPGTTRNEFAVVVGRGHPSNGSVLVYFPARGTQYLGLRYHLRPLNLGSKKQMSMEEGKKYIATFGDDAMWHLTTRGETGVLGRQYVQTLAEDEITKRRDCGENILTASLTSSIALDEVFIALEQKGVFDYIDDKRVVDEEYADVMVDSLTGKLHYTSDFEPILPVDVDIPQELTVEEFRRPIRSTAGLHSRNYSSFASGILQGFTTFLCSVGTILHNLQTGTLPDMSPIMASAAISHDEYIRCNPKWSKASKGPEKDKWIAADKKESDQQFDPTHTTMKEVIGGRSGVPFGMPIYPIKRHCKIKDSGTYKVRWVVLGNLDDYDGDTYAPTACKKVVWLIFALSVLLGLYRRFFDIKGAFMAERPTRDIFVELDGIVYQLMYSLYGLKDAPLIFNVGLVTHLKNGGYTQSAWDQCLFFKWVSMDCFIYMIFHVDDFYANGTSEAIIDEFHRHLEQKYTVTSNCDGVFLGTYISPLMDGSSVFRKPLQLQHLFEMYMPNGPIMDIPREPMSQDFCKHFDVEDSPLCDSTKFRALHGKLIQLIDVRPDIAFPVSKLSQRQCRPRVKDMEAQILLVHYLFGTKDKGIVLRRADHASARTLVQLRGFTDMSFACHFNGKSQYCICFDLVEQIPASTLNPLKRLYNTGMFYLKSFMAPTVDLATCEGEIGALVEGCKDGVFFRGVLKELHQEQVEPTPMYGDNDSTIVLATRYSGKHKRVRYMLPKVMWLMEQTKARVFDMLRMGTKELPPDVATKLGVGPEFRDKMDRIMGL